MPSTLPVCEQPKDSKNANANTYANQGVGDEVTQPSKHGKPPSEPMGFLERMKLSLGAETYETALQNLKLTPSTGEVVEHELDLILQRIIDDGFALTFLRGQGESTARNQRILLYLYAKNYFGYNEGRRLQEIVDFLVDDSLCQERLMRIIECDGDVPLETPQVFCDGWTSLLEKSGYMGEGMDRTRARCIFDCHKLTMYFRIQIHKGPSCFMQAAAVCFCYLLQIGTADVTQKIIDLGKFLRACLPDERFSSYAYTGSGGSASAVLFQIIHVKGTHTMDSKYIADQLIGQTDKSPRIWRYLKEHGPALVTGFRVDAAFSGRQTINSLSEEALPSFSGPVMPVNQGGNTSCYHAMVLVGMKRRKRATSDEPIEWIMVLQNWWKTMQYVEVTAEYLVSSGTQLLWVTERQTKMPEYFPVCDAIVAETHVDGSDSKNGALSCFE
jgi:hypothetical protein